MAEYDKNLAVAGTHTLETKGLRKRYGRRVVVKDVSLRVVDCSDANGTMGSPEHIFDKIRTALAPILDAR